MLSLDQIREIARHQRLRGVEVVGVKGHHGSVRIRVAEAASASAGVGGSLGTAESSPVMVGTKTVKVRSDRLGTVILSGRGKLVQPVQGGDALDQGQLLALIELGEKAHAVVAPVKGTVRAVLVQDGQRADYGLPMFELTSDEG